MIDDFAMAWSANKDRLKQYLMENLENDFGSYQSLVKVLFDQVINPYLKKEYLGECFNIYNTDRIHEINDSEYEGCLLYVIPLNNYFPSCDDYVLTYVEYGSCPICDTLQGIWELSDHYPPEKTVRDLMTLCLHLLQHCVKPFDFL